MDWFTPRTRFTYADEDEGYIELTATPPATTVSHLWAGRLTDLLGATRNVGITLRVRLA